MEENIKICTTVMSLRSVFIYILSKVNPLNEQVSPVYLVRRRPDCTGCGAR